jgi:hypothetical protein
MNHAFIYSSEGQPTGALGWFLQQSESYKSNFFTVGEHNLVEAYLHPDPWDNHSSDPDHWSHQYIECIEKMDDDFAWINSFVSGFTKRTIFGLSYGAWSKLIPWKNKTVDLIYIEPTEQTYQLFFNSYLRRPVDMDFVKESIDMHVHDHHQDDPVYREHIYSSVYNDALKYAELGELRFWQLQHCFHHGGTEIPSPDRHDEMRKITFSDKIAPYYEKNEKRCIVVDIFNLDIKNICEKLDIIYNDKMEYEYQRFLKFADDIAQV